MRKPPFTQRKVLMKGGFFHIYKIYDGKNDTMFSVNEAILKPI